MLFAECVFWTRVSLPRGDKRPVVVIDNKDGKNKFSCFSKNENSFPNSVRRFRKSLKGNGGIIFQKKWGKLKIYWKKDGFIDFTGGR